MSVGPAGRIGRRARALAAGLGLLALAACTAPPAPKERPRAGKDERPPLVVLVVVDQMRADYLDRFGPAFRGGFARLLAEGAVFTEAAHAHGVTHTAAGHASIVTGRFPAHTGIVANTWYDRTGHREAYSATDDEDVASPARLIGDALGDWMKRADERSRVVTASAKDRTAVLLGGRRPDAAYWFDGAKGRFRTSPYYARRMPSWFAAFDTRAGARTYFARAWEPLPLPAGVDRASLGVVRVDTGAFASGFPHLLGGLQPSPSKGFFTEVGESPWIDEMLAGLADELVEHHELGADEVPDLLGLSFSALDFVGHDYGPQSAEALDVLVRVDRLLGKLFERLDARLGRGRYLVALTADHGVAPLPEASGGVDRRVGVAEALCFQRVEGELTKRHGGQGWFEWGLYLDSGTVAKAGLQRPAVAAEAAALLAACPGVERVLTASEVADPAALTPAGAAADPVRAAYARSFRAERSPDLFVHWQEHVVASLGTGTTHHGAWPFERRVPLIFAGPGVAAGRHDEAVWTVDVAPTLATLLGVPVPSGLDGVDRAASLASRPGVSAR